ncbi:hypothetical protein DAPPUDRAFT_99924 [Daphnia pulex]|uniref:Ig-like domain-containing protein n=1 Tax=Daphnia pulex TaxID=6669 RepID=E9G8S4_DAPPU|nr:hypothetical protein DAPPUDRAFT_99924 [Daphnia pulex]|eukprot:EFX84217.1 hypothetical protein DAPPUDRAFT_99924 [Daphnia pulex]
MAFPTSLFLVATVCCLTIVNAAGETLRPLPSDANNRQQFNQQMFMVAPPHLGYNQYHPYGGQAMMQPSAGGFYPYYPFAAGWRYPSVDQGGFTKLELSDRAARDPIIIGPAAAECASGTIEADGIGPCVKTSGAKRGSISIKLPIADQTAVVAIVRSSTSRITLRCSEMNAVAAFTQTGKIADKSVVRTETGVMQLVVTSTGDNGVMKCTW